MIPVKICGLRTPESVSAAVKCGAAFLGFVFYPPSPRFVTPEQALPLIADVPGHVRTVGLFVDPSDEELERTLTAVRLDMIQLHGQETPERLCALRALSGKPVIKALRVGVASDLEAARRFETAADWLLFDSRPADAALPGGTGQSFDWRILEGFVSPRPWMLSGGLNAGNIRDALSALRPDAVDLSSGVERAPGQKDPALIEEFFRSLPG